MSEKKPSLSKSSGAFAFVDEHLDRRVLGVLVEDMAALHVARAMGPASVVARVVVNPATGEQRYVTASDDHEYESLKSAVSKPMSTTLSRVSVPDRDGLRRMRHAANEAASLPPAKAKARS